MRLHLVGFPHTWTTAAYSACAYTQKLRKLCKMLGAAGHEVVLYAGAENDAPCAEHVPLVSAAEQLEWFGPHTPPAYPHIDWDPNAKPWQVMNHRAIAEIAKRAEPHELLLLSMGWSQKAIADAFDSSPTVNRGLRLLAAEHGVGYVGTFTHAAFESYAWMHHVYGINGQRAAHPGVADVNGGWFDTVIPNYFDPDEFPHPRDTNAKLRDPYLLFVGRVTYRKGPLEASLIAEQLGMRLVVAGPGVLGQTSTELLGDGVKLVGGHVEYAGVVGIEERAQLMANASVLLAPTLYVEPFGGVAVEAMLSGTPAVTSDWGAFTETVREGVSGYRFRNLAGGVEAVQAAMKLNRRKVREYALDRYALAAVAPLYDRWFAQLDTLWREGWHEMPAAA